jgi:hypothetical protein
LSDARASVLPSPPRFPRIFCVVKTSTGSRVTAVLARILSKPGFIDQRIEFHHTILSAAALDLTVAAIAAGLAQVGRVNFSGASGSSGGTVDVSGSTFGYWTPVGVGIVVFSTAMLVDAGSSALWSHAPAEVHATLKPAPR